MIEKCSIYDDCVREAAQYRWIESEKAGYDLGEAAILWEHECVGFTRFRVRFDGLDRVRGAGHFSSIRLATFLSNQPIDVPSLSRSERRPLPPRTASGLQGSASAAPGHLSRSYSIGQGCDGLPAGVGWPG